MSAETGPFELDIHPEKLRQAARKMRSMGRDFAERGDKLRTMPGDIGDSWTGKAARSAKAEMRGLATHLADFSQDMTDSREAVRKLAEHYDDALQDVKRLNRKWEQADNRYTSAVAKADRQLAERTEPGDEPAHDDPVHRSAKQSARLALEADQAALWREFEELQHEVKRQTRTCARALAREVPLPVTPDAVTLYQHYRWTAVEPERPEFNENMPLSQEKDRTDPPDPMEGQDGNDKLSKYVEDANDVFLGTALEYGKLDADERVKLLKEQAAFLRREERRARRAQYERRGTPAGRRATNQLEDLTRRADDVDVELNRGAYKLLRGLPWVGTAAGVGKDVYDVATGQEEAGKVIVTGGAGLAGGAIAVAVASGPVGWGVLGVAAAGAGGAYVASEVASWAWDKGYIQSAGKGIADGAKKAWKSVFG